MFCQDCARYDSDQRRCLDQKVNPQDWSTAVDVANVLGLRSICVFNDFRERLINCRGNKVATLDGPAAQAAADDSR